MWDSAPIPKVRGWGCHQTNISGQPEVEQLVYTDGGSAEDANGYLESYQLATGKHLFAFATVLHRAGKACHQGKGEAAQRPWFGNRASQQTGYDFLGKTRSMESVDPPSPPRKALADQKRSAGHARPGWLARRDELVVDARPQQKGGMPLGQKGAALNGEDAHVFWEEAPSLCSAVVSVTSNIS